MECLHTQNAIKKKKKKSMETQSLFFVPAFQNEVPTTTAGFVWTPVPYQQIDLLLSWLL